MRSQSAQDAPSENCLLVNGDVLIAFLKTNNGLLDATLGLILGIFGLEVGELLWERPGLRHKDRVGSDDVWNRLYFRPWRTDEEEAVGILPTSHARKDDLVKTSDLSDCISEGGSIAAHVSNHDFALTLGLRLCDELNVSLVQGERLLD